MFDLVPIVCVTILIFPMSLRLFCKMVCVVWCETRKYFLLYCCDERKLRSSGHARKRRAGYSARMYLFKEAPHAALQLLGSGAILREVIQAAELLKKDYDLEGIFGV